MDGTIRIRTVAVSAAAAAAAAVVAVLCTLLVTEAWSVDATPGDSDSTFVPTAGCRVADSRAAFAVGPRKAPLAADETLTVAIHGENGDCAGALAIPADAVAVALNVTATNATTNSNVRLFPADLTDVPKLSNLNVSAGAPPTPNKVDVKLSPDGKIKVYNFRGSVIHLHRHRRLPHRRHPARTLATSRRVGDSHRSQHVRDREPGRP